MGASEPLEIARGDAVLVGERWSGEGPVVVLVHAGVTDSRSWWQVAAGLAGWATTVAYDRRGFGETATSQTPFSHVDDLIAVLDAVAHDPVWLVGSSAGGGIALDTALLAPERLAGLVLLAPAVSGAPVPELDADTARLDRLLDQAYEAGDLDEVNRLETWLWLDGPAQPEGRVTGPARALAKDMNARILANGVPEGAGASGFDAWGRLVDIRPPVTVACGELDVPFLIDRSRVLADRLPNARYQVLPGTAHLPQLEQPATIAELLTNVIKRH